MVAQPSADPAFADLTARARIRDAALRLFAERGIDAATVRDIAKAAGVSAGLVRHHFGSKEALRDACDAHALEKLKSIKETAYSEMMASRPAILPSGHPAILQLMRYLAQSMVDGSPAAAALFDQLVEYTEQWLAAHRPGHSDDPHAFAAVLVALQAGVLVMHDHLSRALGADTLTPEGNVRMGKATVDIYSKPLLDPELAAQAHATYDQLLANRTTEGERP
jgi:AcrR family transcriptional regulator